MIEGICKRESLHYKCPNCGEFSSSMTHIEVRGTFGPWYCSDCGYGYHGKRISENEVDLKIAERKIDTLVLLRIKDTSIFAVVKGVKFTEDLSRDEYFYNEHLAHPIMEVECFIQGNDDDPHGLFQWVETIIKPEDYEEEIHSRSKLEYFKTLFQSLRSES
jgi:ribosomal protein L37AE/L43A